MEHPRREQRRGQRAERRDEDDEHQRDRDPAGARGDERPRPIANARAANAAISSGSKFQRIQKSPGTAAGPQYAISGSACAPFPPVRPRAARPLHFNEHDSKSTAGEKHQRRTHRPRRIAWSAASISGRRARPSRQHIGFQPSVPLTSAPCGRGDAGGRAALGGDRAAGSQEANLKVGGCGGSFRRACRRRDFSGLVARCIPGGDRREGNSLCAFAIPCAGPFGSCFIFCSSSPRCSRCWRGRCRPRAISGPSSRLRSAIPAWR